MNNHLKIDNPCSENWNEMKIGLNSRFCDNCCKNVIDFTNFSREEIIEYLLKNQNEKTCGRVQRSQLDFSNTDLLVTIKAMARQAKTPSMALYILSLGALLIAGCNNNVKNSDSQILPKVIFSEKIDTTKDITQLFKNKNSNSLIETAKDTEIIIGKMNIDTSSFLLGELIVEPKNLIEQNFNFPGGYDSLESFIRRNLVYPKWEQDNNIEGTVAVDLTFDKNGKIIKAKIQKSVEGSKNFDDEVLRVINLLPNWVPENDSIKTSNFNVILPIVFELE